MSCSPEKSNEACAEPVIAIMSGASRPRAARNGRITLVAVLRHPRARSRACPTAGSRRRGTRRRGPRASTAALLEVPIELRRHDVHVGERPAGELELPARLDRDREAALLRGDDPPLLLERLVAEAREPAQHRARRRRRALVRHRLERAGAQDQLLVLEADLPGVAGPLARAEPRDELVDSGDGGGLVGAGVERHARGLYNGHPGGPAENRPGVRSRGCAPAPPSRAR